MDISSVTPEKTNVKRGDYDIDTAKTSTMTVNKAQGASTAILRGYACEPVDTVTPNVYQVTTTASDAAVVISALPFAYIPANVEISNGEDVSATDDNVALQAITRSDSVVVKLSGTGQPGNKVMTAANGEFVKYDDSDPELIKGVFKGLPGTQGGNIIKQGWTDGVLGIISFNGGA
ncbi:MAG: hypothetical protein L0H53_04475 [Candidatus Nitrosocosmicus sp.]|nr:hypothetical protein [Candidatus Nitrosocosmicus sp.]